MEQILVARGESKTSSVQLISYREKKFSRVYSFIEFDEKNNRYVHKQLENRNGKIMMRSKVRKMIWFFFLKLDDASK